MDDHEAAPQPPAAALGETAAALDQLCPLPDGQEWDA